MYIGSEEQAGPEQAVKPFPLQWFRKVFLERYSQDHSVEVPVKDASAFRNAAAEERKQTQAMSLTTRKKKLLQEGSFRRKKRQAQEQEQKQK